MSEENITITAVIRGDIRNPWAKLVFSPERIMTDSRVHVLFMSDLKQEDVLRVFNRLKTSQTFFFFSVRADETRLVHDLNKLFSSKIREIELIASRAAADEFKRLSFWGEKNKSFTTFASLMLNNPAFFKLTPNDFGEQMLYDVKFKLSGSSSLVTS